MYFRNLHANDSLWDQVAYRIFTCNEKRVISLHTLHCMMHIFTSSSVSIKSMNILYLHSSTVTLCHGDGEDKRRQKTTMKTEERNKQIYPKCILYYSDSFTFFCICIPFNLFFPLLFRFMHLFIPALDPIYLSMNKYKNKYLSSNLLLYLIFLLLLQLSISLFNFCRFGRPYKTVSDQISNVEQRHCLFFLHFVEMLFNCMILERCIFCSVNIFDMPFFPSPVLHPRQF